MEDAMILWESIVVPLSNEYLAYKHAERERGK